MPTEWSTNYHTLKPFTTIARRYEYKTMFEGAETWRVIPSTFTDRFVWEVSMRGRVRKTYLRGKRRKHVRKYLKCKRVMSNRLPNFHFTVVPLITSSGGYKFAEVERARQPRGNGPRKRIREISILPVHLLVARAFLGVPERRYLVVHKDGDVGNNDVDNLSVQMACKYLRRYKIRVKSARSEVSREKYKRALQYWIDGHPRLWITQRLDITKDSFKRVKDGAVQYPMPIDACATIQSFVDQGMSKRDITRCLRIGAKTFDRAIRALTREPFSYGREVEGFVDMVESEHLTREEEFLPMPEERIQQTRREVAEQRLQLSRASTFAPRDDSVLYDLLDLAG